MSKRSYSSKSPSRLKRPVKGFPPQVAITLMLMSSTMVCAVLAANLAATKIWNFYSIPVDGGIFMFPITYVLGDLLAEIYGKRIANRVAACSFVLGLATCGMLWFVALLPDYPGVDNIAFAGISSMASRVTVASLIAYLPSQYTNNYTFELFRKSLGEQHLRLRFFLSSAVAHVVDTVIFEPLAFYGRLPLSELIAQASLAYITSLALEATLLPLTCHLAKHLSRKLHFNNGKCTS